MKKPPFNLGLILLAISGGPFGLVGCSTQGGVAADFALAGAGGVIGYEATNHKIGGAAVGASAGYVASKVVQSEIQRTMREAEKRGFDQAMNQAVKQQYWIIQNQQRSSETNEREPRLLPVVIPETKINGVVQIAHVEYLRVEP